MTNEELKMCARCQIRWERDKAMEQLAEHHIPFMCVAEDVVEVVRCKDCKNWDTTWQDGWAKNYHYCPLIDGTRNGDWFCAYGEKRE